MMYYNYKKIRSMRRNFGFVSKGMSLRVCDRSTSWTVKAELMIIIIKVLIPCNILSGRPILSTHTHPRTPNKTPAYTSKLYTIRTLT